MFLLNGMKFFPSLDSTTSKKNKENSTNHMFDADNISTWSYACQSGVNCLQSGSKITII